MITDDLIAYIQAQLKKDTPKESIVSKLVDVGWKEADIEEGFQTVSSLILDSSVSKIEKKIDPYRELTDEEEEALSKKSKLEKAQEVKTKVADSFTGVWAPVKIKTLDESSFNKEHVGLTMTASSFRDHKLDTPKIIPTNVVESSLPVSDLPKKEDTPINVTPIRSSVFERFSKDESATQNNLGIRNIKTDVGVQGPEETSQKNKSALWMTIFLILLLLIGGLTFALMKGYINLSNINIPFIKKDPKVLLLNNSTKLSSLKSYKTETNINVSSPTFANITNGLISGEEISSIDKDSISIQSLSMINQNNGSINSENSVTIKSSILKDAITTNIKNNGANIFIRVPDLSQIMGNDAPKEQVVLFKQGEFDQVIPILPSILAERAKQVDVYKILSEGISSYITNNGMMVYKNFIDNTSIIEKDPEIIRGMDTYHYDINTDKQITKKLLKEIANTFFVSTMSDYDKTKLDEILGSVNISSFEIWIGKNDNNIYQYRINLSVPLSQILGLEDSGIGDSEVKLDWTTTYYDFDIANEISMPQDFVTIDNFMKSSNDIKLKNEINSFPSLASVLKNSEGGFGKTINKSGSCIKPDWGSLFSPLGHTKGASLVVGDIANAMNNILLKTNNTGSCYSNLTAWAMAFPLESEIGSSYCLDSTGVSGISTNELKDIKCNLENLPQTLPTN